VVAQVDSVDIYIFFSNTGGENVVSAKLTWKFCLDVNHFVPNKLHQQPGINLFCTNSFLLLEQSQGMSNRQVAS
jgi:hypothetical protein